MSYFYKYRFSQLYNDGNVKVLNQKDFDAVIEKYSDRPANKKCIVDLSGCVLRDVTLCENYDSEKNKISLVLNKSALERCILTETLGYESMELASVVDSFIEDVDFDKMNFKTAYFENTDINNCYFEGCDFSNSYMKGCFFFETKIKQSRCESMIMEDTDLVATMLRQCDFRDSRFTGDLFKGCDIRENNFDNSYAERTGVDALSLTEHNSGFCNLIGCVYKVEPNTAEDAAYGDYFIQAYRKNENGNLGIGDILYIGDYERCSDIQRSLNYGTMREPGVKNMYEQEKNIRNQLVVPVYKGDTIPEDSAGRKKYTASLNENRKCESLIAEICKNLTAGENTGIKEEVQNAINSFGRERVEYIAAGAIKSLKTQKDIAEENKDWAESMEIPASFAGDTGSLANINPSALNEFASALREENALDETKKLPPKLVPIYRGPSPYDVKLSTGDMRKYKASQKASADCAIAIGEAINQHSDTEHSRIDVKAAYNDAVRRFGYDRVKFVTANTIKYYEYDGRISKENKEWAYNVRMPEHNNNKNNQRITDRVHHIIINAFADVVRQNDTYLRKEKELEPNSFRSLVEDARSTINNTKQHAKTKTRQSSVEL